MPLDGAGLFEPLQIPKVTRKPRPLRRPRVDPKRKPMWPLDQRINVVLFAGLGGACDGLEQDGHQVHLAINHDKIAIAAHKARHPHTRHIQTDIFEVDPRAATRGRSVGILWASPDCRHFSRAKGGAPVSRRVRSLPWVVCRWAGTVRPETIFMENVPEITGWTHLVAKRDPDTGRVLKLDGTIAAKGERVPIQEQQLVPDPKRVSRVFRSFMAHLRRLGYRVEWRPLVAADNGIATIRRRFFMVAQRDSQPIVWPARTHAPRNLATALGLQPWVPAASIIDWSLPCPSIFERSRPLVNATCRRLAKGIHRHVINNAQPFLMPITHNGDGRTWSLGEPLRTLTTSKGGEFTLVMPTLDRQFGASEEANINEPLPTITSGGSGKTALVAAFMAQHNLGNVARDMEEPLSTLTARCTQQTLVAMHLTHYRGTSQDGLDINDPAPALTAGGRHVGLVAAFMQQYYSTGGQDSDAANPVPALTTKARSSVVTVTIDGITLALSDIGMRMLHPKECARAHGLDPASLDLDIEYFCEKKNRRIRRKLTLTEQYHLIGNSVPPEWARLLANCNARPALSLEAA